MPHPVITGREAVSDGTEPAFHVADADGKSQVLGHTRSQAFNFVASRLCDALVT